MNFLVTSAFLIVSLLSVAAIGALGVVLIVAGALCGWLVAYDCHLRNHSHRRRVR